MIVSGSNFSWKLNTQNKRSGGGGGAEGRGSTSMFNVVCYVKSTSFTFIVTDLVLFASVAFIPEYKSRDKTWTLQIYTFTD